MEIERLPSQYYFDQNCTLTCNYMRWMWLGIAACGWP
jgi:hypothetical protein